MIIRVKSAARRKLIKNTFVMGISVIASHYLAFRISTIANSVWWDCYKVACVLMAMAFLIWDLCILHSSKCYSIDTERRTIQKGKKGKPKKFDRLSYRESFCQIVFWVGTLEARGGELKIPVKIKDVPDSTVEKIKQAFMAEGK